MNLRALVLALMLPAVALGQPCPGDQNGRGPQSFATGSVMAGDSVPPSTWKTLPVTHPPAGDAR